ncbi:GNAT family N-acetyltransferase [Parachitinimonas caeni]|uniref:GNAT family N-acetyltransferase n=1 Tax=Parachitinimonas caeni TaxID=3031301 RepID=A0ABT7DVJ1_9NEIS|nr:GNAT family N-acetyltransferase [Parachitinimonas caeni]MDK2124083.1 GNAT family N-acetyltransferase [Parachitinimonas caeni]
MNLSKPTLHTPFPSEIQGYRARLLNESDAGLVISLRHSVLAELVHPDVYVQEDNEHSFVAEHCGPRGQTIGLFDKDTLIAYAAVGFPERGDEDNLGKVVGLSDLECANVAHIASCMVAKGYRGRGLQRLLIAARFAVCEAHQRCHGLAMVSLYNHPSRHNMLKQGMYIRWVGELHCGHDTLRRQLLYINLNSRVTPAGTQKIWLASDDFASQAEHVTNGWVGVADLREGDSAKVCFVR